MSSLEREKIAWQAVVEALNGISPEMRVVGSSYISNTTGSDVDIIVHHTSLKSTGAGPDSITDKGWRYGGSDKGGDGWCSFTKAVQDVLVNLIIVDDLEYYRAWGASADTCRMLHLAGHSLPRALVHAVHSIVMDGHSPTYALRQRGVQIYE